MAEPICTASPGISVSYSIPGFDFCLPDGKVAVLQLDRHNLFNSLARHRVKGPYSRKLFPGMKLGIKTANPECDPSAEWEISTWAVTGSWDSSDWEAERYRFQHPESTIRWHRSEFRYRWYCRHGEPWRAQVKQWILGLPKLDFQRRFSMFARARPCLKWLTWYTR